MTENERKALITDNLKLINYICAKIVKVGPAIYEDCVGVASLALCNAAQKFNPNIGVKFSTFACKIMKYEVFLYLNKEKKKGMTGIPETAKTRIVFTSLEDVASDNNAYVSEIIEEKIDIADIKKSLNAIATETEWTVFTMLYDKHMSVKEVAKKRFVSETTIRSTIFRLHRKYKNYRKCEVAV